MAGLQTIIDLASTINVNRRKVVGVQITRNEIPRTSLTPTRLPWQFTVEVPAAYRWQEYRTFIETMDYLDRYQPQTITFNNTCLDWMFAYQGSASNVELDALHVYTFSGTELRLTNVTTKSGSFVWFQPNDLIQIGANPYPFTVVGTYDPSTHATTIGPVYGSATPGTDLYIKVNRENFFSTSVTGAGVTVGPECQFNVFCPNMPTYKLVPGGYQNYSGTQTTYNNALIEWSDPFNLYEYVGAAS